MRRPTRLGLAIAILLVAVFGAYSVFWFVVAGRIESGFGEWAQSLRAQNLDLSWRAIRVGGFPLAFQVELDDARLQGGAASPGFQIGIPVLSGGAAPWNLFVWRLAAPQGLSATAGPPDRPAAKLAARTASGSVAVSGEAGATVWLGLGETSGDIGMQLAARDAQLWLILPPHQPQTHSGRGVAAALHIKGLTLPVAPPPFRNPLDEIALGATVKGAIPASFTIKNGPPREAAVAWRDSGGTMELDRFAARWGTLAIRGSGTLALDRDLQPIGALSGAIEGYEELMAAFVAAGMMRASDARLASLVLRGMAKPGPDGRPTIATSFTIQDGEMRLGPVKLGRTPRITWE